MLTANKSHSKDCKSLNEWLSYLETIHQTEIDLGLARISQVAKRLRIDVSFARVITVAGTNGKGTTCAFLENAFLDEKLNDKTSGEHSTTVGVYSSPHIEHFNERLRINKRNVDDQPLITAFEKIESARAEISLSYYEYTTLAALLVLMEVRPEVIILEVGLGGRLDATNIIDADVAVITSVDLDHQAFLGNDRETIGLEKAGIMRANQHIIVGDPNAPQSVLAHANKVNNTGTTPTQYQQALTKVKIRNKDFFVTEQAITNKEAAQGWQWRCIETDNAGKNKETCFTNLATTYIPQDNVASALMVLKQLGITLTTAKINALIAKTQVAGRTELFSKSSLIKQSVNKDNLVKNNIKIPCDVMFDVGHNPHAGRYLANKLAELKSQHQYHNIIAVTAMLADKDIENTLAPFSDVIDDWYIAPLAVPRAATTKQMSEALQPFTNSINCFDNITQAFKMANQTATSADLILVFGSFYTVAQIRQLLI